MIFSHQAVIMLRRHYFFGFIIYRRVHALRNCLESFLNGYISHYSGYRRRRVDSHFAIHPQRNIPAGRTGNGHGNLRNGNCSGAGPRTDPWRVADR